MFGPDFNMTWEALDYLDWDHDYHEPPIPMEKQRFWPPKNQVIYHKTSKNVGFGGSTA